MILTTRTMEWLNQNRRRAYPAVRDDWRACSEVAANRDLDSVLLDALVLDADATGDEMLTIESVSVKAAKTVVGFKYGGRSFEIALSGGTESGEGSFVCKKGTVTGSGLVGASISLSFSSHAYLLRALGEGSWTLGCAILPTRVIRLTDGVGVEKVATNGSSGVTGHETAVDVTGEVVLEDGYRTSPIIAGGRVMVRVGKRYGHDPCRYDFGDAGSRDCREPLFFFCGQNAVNGGNVVLRGGRGVSVTQGRTYTVNSPKSKCDGKTIPCIEIVAGRELLDICKIS